MPPADMDAGAASKPGKSLPHPAARCCGRTNTFHRIRECAVSQCTEFKSLSQSQALRRRRTMLSAFGRQCRPRTAKLTWSVCPTACAPWCEGDCHVRCNLLGWGGSG